MIRATDVGRPSTGRWRREAHAVMAIAARDLLKFLRDPLRIVSTLVFPVVFVLILGGSFEAVAGDRIDFRTYVFVGVLAQSMWQSAALGLVSLIEDRENDFSQAIFIAPISRYSIVFGKIVGESLVALAQGAVILIFGLLIGVRYGLVQLGWMVPASVIACLYGGAFGLILMANIRTQRTAQQIFPFLILPQFFLAGVFNFIDQLEGPLALLSLISPMRYAVDLLRGAFYVGYPDDVVSAAVVADAGTNLLVIAVLFLTFMGIGTARFVQRERNR